MVLDEKDWGDGEKNAIKMLMPMLTKSMKVLRLVYASTKDDYLEIEFDDRNKVDDQMAWGVMWRIPMFYLSFFLLIYSLLPWIYIQLALPKQTKKIIFLQFFYKHLG